MAAPVFPVGVNLTKSELQNARIHFLGTAPASPVEGQFYYDSVSHVLGVWNGSVWLLLGRLDQLNAPTASVSFNSQKITSLAPGTNGTDGVNLNQLQDAIAGLNVKDSVRVATTAAGTLASSFENGDAIDGVTLATSDRILIKNQAAGAENGIYTVNASGAPTRATDADSATDIRGAAVFVEEGTVNNTSLWVLSTDPPITLGTTALTFAQFLAGTIYTVGTNGGLQLTGNAFSILLRDGSLTLDGSGLGLTIPVTVARGGTNATDAAGAKTSLGFMTRYEVDIGNGSLSSITVTHNLGTKAVAVEVYDNTTPFSRIYPDIQHATTNTIIVDFGSQVPTSAQYHCVVIG